MASDIPNPPPQQLALLLHTSTNHITNEGCGIAIVQRTSCTPPATTHPPSLPDQERRYGFRRRGLAIEKIQTVDRARMYAISMALSLAHETFKKHDIPDSVEVHKITVFSESPEVVRLFGTHIEGAPASLKDVGNRDDRRTIKGVVAKARKLARCGIVDIAIVVNDGKDEEGEQKAKVMARQKGRVACRARRRGERRGECGGLGMKKDKAGKDEGRFKRDLRGKGDCEAVEHAQDIIY